MDPSGATALTRIWADATPLAKHLEDRAERLCTEAPAISGTRLSASPSTLERIAVATQYHANMAVAREAARTATANDLIAGRLITLGRPADRYALQRINPKFWIGAEIDWMRSTVSRGGKNFVNIRIASTLATAKTSIRKSVSKPTQRDTRNSSKRRGIKRPTRNAGGRPGTSDAIRKVVRHLLKASPGFAAMPRKRMVGEVRAHLLGPARRNEEVPGYRTASMVKVIGSEVAKSVNWNKRNKRNKRNKPRSA
jgi:hypothetical protein